MSNYINKYSSLEAYEAGTRDSNNVSLIEDSLGNQTVIYSDNISSSVLGEILSLIQTVLNSLSEKQNTLVSGTNIKTINGNSVLGSGNLVIETQTTIVNDLTTGGTGDALSAEQGKVLNNEITEIGTDLSNFAAQTKASLQIIHDTIASLHADTDLSALQSIVNAIDYNVATPTITIDSNGVTMSADSGCSIYYTTDGSTPTSASTQYTNAINLPLVATTYKAIAVDAYGNISSVQESSVPYELLPLAFEAIEDGRFILTIDSGVPTSLLSDVSYSTDNGETWVTTSNVDNSQVIITTPIISASNKVLWKGNGTAMSPNLYNTSRFSSTNQFNVEGNIMSLLYGDNFKNNSAFAENILYNFSNLFSNAYTIISAENLILPATTLANYCYYNMFQGCARLTSTPELPATTLADYCYSNMFYGCTSLTTAPELPATTLVTYCYSFMFYQCRNLTVAPELSATTLATNCYASMFSGCTSLTTTSELPATRLYNYCYSNMFQGCTSLTTTPELPATTLASNCYNSMFYGCTSLTTTPELPVTTLAVSCYRSMFYNCTSLTSTPELPATIMADYCYASMFYGCTGLTVAPNLPATTLAKYCYQEMFRGCTGLTSTPELPVKTLATSCYARMFSGCTSLTTAPNLPATTLAIYCYQSMFSGCTSLTTTPELRETTLKAYCYDSMFQGCTSLTSTPELPATTLAEGCYANMFKDCTGLTTTSELPATRLYNYCYSTMFYGCTSLTTAPELPAITLTSNCYQLMFRGCTNLNYIKALFTTTPSSSYTSSWVSEVASTGTFVKNSAATWNVTGVNGVPSGWTVETATA